MDQYGTLGGRTGQDVVDIPTNLIRLRADIHHLWDQRDFSIVPRCRRDGISMWAACVMTQDPESLELSHNVEVQSLAALPPEFLLARFAWDIFPTLLAFLQSRQPRVLAVRRVDGKVEVQQHDPHECRKFAEGQGPGRSSSPSKRQRKDVAVDQQVSCQGSSMHWRTGTPLSGSFDSAVAGLDEDDCVTSAVLEWKCEGEQTVHYTSDGLDNLLSWKDREQMALDE